VNFGDFNNFEGNNHIVKYNDSLLCVLSRSTFIELNSMNKFDFNDIYYSQKFSNFIYSSNDSLKNLLPIYKKSEVSNVFNNFYPVLEQNIDKKNNIYRLKIDKDNNLYIISIKDTLKNISEDKLNISLDGFSNRLSNLFIKDNICFAENIDTKTNFTNQYTKLYLLNSKYKKINEIKRENKYIDYIYSNGVNEYISYEFDYKDSIKYVIHTKDNFKTLDTLYSFSKNDFIIYKDYYEFNHRDTDYVVFF